jgi:hypothetical protein
MAGSIKEMLYTSDTGEIWLVKVDESNGEAFGFADFTGVETFNQVGVPPGAQMRYVNWRSDTGQLKRKFWVGKPDHTGFINGGAVTVATLNGNTAVPLPGNLTSAVGEKRRLPNTSTAGEDTGLNDGDNT